MTINSIYGQMGDAYPSNSLVSVVTNQLGYVSQNVINEYSVMTVPAFWRGVRFLSSTLAGLPKCVHVKAENERIKADSHPLNTVLNRKCSNLAIPFSTFETLYHHATVWGNGYLAIQRDAKYNPTGLLNINPEIITPFRIGGEKYFFIEANDTSFLPDVATVDAITENGRNVKGFVLMNDDVIHVMLPGFNAIRGYPLVWFMRDSLQGAKNAERHSSKYFENGGFIRGSLSFPGALTPEQIATMRQSLDTFKTGGSNEWNYLILQSGGELKNSTLPNETSQLIETRKFNNIEIAQMLSIPPHILYMLDDAKYANVEQMGIDVVKYSLAEWIIKSEQEFTLKLLNTSEQEAGYYIRFNVDGLLRGDAKSRTDNVIALVNNGLMKPNDGCALLELPSLGADGDRLRVPVNVSAPIDTLKPSGGSAAPAGDGSAEPPAATPAASGSEGAATAPAAADGYSERLGAVLEPLMRAAAAEVETKTAKAFANKEGKPEGELTIWANVFAEQQKQMTLERFLPIAAAAQPLGLAVDVTKIAERYSAEIRRYAATKEKRDLLEIAKEIISNGQ